MKLLIYVLSLIFHVLTSPLTIGLSFALLIGTWWICRQVRLQRPAILRNEGLFPSEWVGT